MKTTTRAEAPPPSKPPNARLVVIAGDEVGMRFSIEGEATIGRSDATVLLEDEEVSRRHARIRWTASRGYRIEDLHSSNGTFVNGQPVKSQLLRFGDEISLGQVKLAFQHLDPVEEEQLQRQRLEALGRIGAGIAHDFNNALGIMLGNLEYLESNLEERKVLDDESRECMGDMTGAIDHASSLVSRLLHAVSDKPRRDARCNVTSICEQVLKIIRRTFDRSIQVVQDLEPHLVAVGDSVELHQVLMNLCLNGRDAMPEGGTLTVKARLSNPREMEDDPQFADRSAVVLTVTDSGLGMDAETLASAFEPFFTTKNQTAGFGLGLATSREFIVANGGRLDAQSAPGRGSTFRVLLPAASLAPPTRRRHTPVYLPRAASLRETPRGTKVLIADDELMLRRMLERTLRDAGYEVLVARDGAEAVRMYAETQPRPDLVLLDLDMPTLSGEDAQRQLRQLNADVRVVVLTGHGSEEQERRVRQDGALAVLHKPAKTARLLDTLDRALRMSSAPPPSAAGRPASPDGKP